MLPCPYFPPCSTQILCSIIIFLSSTHSPFSPVFILAWQNPYLVKPKSWPSSHLLLGSWKWLEENNHPNWSSLDFMATILTQSSLQLPGNQITFPASCIPRFPTRVAQMSSLLNLPTVLCHTHSLSMILLLISLTNWEEYRLLKRPLYLSILT